MAEPRNRSPTARKGFAAMPAMKKGYKALLDEANAEIDAVTPAEALRLSENDDVLLVDIRDVRELQREGKIPGALHAPRGMLEFWIDPESPYHKPVFSSGKTFIFFCAGGLRSALATKTVQDMGLSQVKHIEGGFGAWREAGLPIEKPEPK
jgi:rhodanese-related sulfurtransferase